MIGSLNAVETSFGSEKEEIQNCSTEENNHLDKSSEEDILSEPPTKQKVAVALHKESKVLDQIKGVKRNRK